MNDKIERIVAVIDFYIICFFSSAVTGILTLGKFNVTPLTVTAYLSSYVLLMLFKDFTFKNASIGKWIFKFKVAKTDGTKLTIIDGIKRNIPIIVLLPVEVFLVIINDRRIGDIWAKTSIVYAKGSNNTY